MSLLHPPRRTPWRRRTEALLVGASALAVAAGGLTAVAAAPDAPVAPAAASGACPAGYTSYADFLAQEQRVRAGSEGGGDALTALADAFALEKARSGESIAAGTCVNSSHPESMRELAWKSLAQALPRVAPVGAVRPGAFGAALKEKGAMKPGGVPGTAGTAEQYGVGPLVVDDPQFPEVNGLGLADNSARVDQFSYDAPTGRLFAAVGSAGVYLSTDLGLSWTSVSDKLPSTITGGVGYAPAKGSRAARAVAVTGDGTFGSSSYTGFGAYYTTDLDQALAAGRQPTWQRSAGVPDGALGFGVTVDPTDADVVYAATSLGLYRSADAGRTFTNAALPTGAAKAGGAPCAGVSDLDSRPECALANMVTDVVVQTAGGTTGAKGGQVVAAVGWRGGNRKNADGTTQSPSNGLYGSPTGAPGTFTKLNRGNVDSPLAFTEQDGIGRISLGAATGPEQDHGYLYAMVQDARLLNGGGKFIDGSPQLPVDLCDPVLGACPLEGGTVLEGLYVSKDFGKTWNRLADDNAIARNPAAGSALVGLGTAVGYEPGVQGWYNQWIEPDPTQAFNGAPTRLAFGLEEVWQNEFVPGVPNAVDGVGDTFKVTGRYFAGDSCQLLSLGLPTCPTNRQPTNSYTTHPDQQDGLFVPVDPEDMSKGVHLFAGNDGGVYRQTVTPGTADDTQDGDGNAIGVTTGDFDNGHWGRGANEGFNALLPYHATMAKDGTVWAGLQDNGHMKIDPARGLKRFETYGGDGFFSAVDPDNSTIAYEEYTGGAMSVTVDGGSTWSSIAPPITGALFSNPFVMDPLDAKHLLTAGNEVVVRLGGPDGDWQQVYDLGTAGSPGTTTAPTPTDPMNRMTAVDLNGASAYVGFCGTCDTLNATVPFKSGLATNVGGALPAEKGSADGWHVGEGRGPAQPLHHLDRAEPGRPEDGLRGDGRLHPPLDAAGHGRRRQRPGRHRPPVRVPRRRRDVHRREQEPARRPRDLGGRPRPAGPGRHRRRRVRLEQHRHHQGRVRAAAGPAQRPDQLDHAQPPRPPRGGAGDQRPRRVDLPVQQRRGRAGRARARPGAAADRYPGRPDGRLRGGRAGLDGRHERPAGPRVGAQHRGLGRLPRQPGVRPVLRHDHRDGDLAGVHPPGRLGGGVLPLPDQHRARLRPGAGAVVERRHHLEHRGHAQRPQRQLPRLRRADRVVHGPGREGVPALLDGQRRQHLVAAVRRRRGRRRDAAGVGPARPGGAGTGRSPPLLPFSVAVGRALALRGRAVRVAPGGGRPAGVGDLLLGPGRVVVGADLLDGGVVGAAHAPSLPRRAARSDDRELIGCVRGRPATGPLPHTADHAGAGPRSAVGRGDSQQAPSAHSRSRRGAYGRRAASPAPRPDRAVCRGDHRQRPRRTHPITCGRPEVSCVQGRPPARRPPHTADHAVVRTADRPARPTARPDRLCARRTTGRARRTQPITPGRARGSWQGDHRQARRTQPITPWCVRPPPHGPDTTT